MKRIGILGNIGSGKSFIAQLFGYPVFNADQEVLKIYKNNKTIFFKLKKALPKYIHSFPINKTEVSYAILHKENNLKKINKTIHSEVRKKMKIFLKKNKNKKFVILDIPLLLENKIANKKDILIFIETKKSDVLKNLKMRKNFNKKLFNKFNRIQLPLDYKRKRSHFVIKNDFKKKTAIKSVKIILNKIKKWMKLY